MERARSADMAETLPVLEIRSRIDGAVVAEREQRARVDLEVEVERRLEGVAGVAGLSLIECLDGQWTQTRASPLRVSQTDNETRVRDGYTS